MSKRGTIAALALATCLSTFSYAHSAPNEPVPVACENLGEWSFSGFLVDLIELVCSVTDAGDPLSIEHGNDSNQEYESAIQQSDLPEEVKQHLLLLLALWSQG